MRLYEKMTVLCSLALLAALDAKQLNAEGLRKYLRDNRSRYLQAPWKEDES